MILTALRQWGEDDLFCDGEVKTVMVDKVKGEPVARLRLMAQDGRVISPPDVEIKRGRASYASEVVQGNL